MRTAFHILILAAMLSWPLYQADKYASRVLEGGSSEESGELPLNFEDALYSEEDAEVVEMVSGYVGELWKKVTGSEKGHEKQGELPRGVAPML